MAEERAFIVAGDTDLIPRISSHLGSLNLSVSWEKDQESALKRLRDEEYDLIFLEEGIPGLRSTEVIQELQSRGSKGCIILISEEPKVEDVVEALQEGAFDYLVKPFSWERLEQSIKKGLENRRSLLEILSLSENLKKKLEELNFLYELSQAIGSTLDLGTIEGILSEKLAQIMEYHILVFSYLEDEKVRIVLYSSLPLGNGLKEEVKEETRKGMKDLTGLEISLNRFSMETRESSIKGNSDCGFGISEYQIPNTKSQMLNVKSSVHAPLTTTGTPLGIMSIWGMGSNFHEDQIRLFQTIANQVAMAFKNAYHHYQTEELAVRDGLTNLLNYRAFHAVLEKELSRSERYQTPLSLILIDIDYFKEINDTYGHQEGDRVLRELGKLFNQSVRRADTAARYGGEEFVLILPETSVSKALTLSERIKRYVENYTFFNWDKSRKLTVSIGISGISWGKPIRPNKDRLIQLADEALYQAKMRGRNQVCIANL